MDAGLSYGDNDFLAEYNEFYDMGHEMGDWNCAYYGADLSMQNNVFQYNFFHHFIETPGAHPIAAVRADDGASGLHMRSNVFVKTGRAAVQFNGPSCSFTNNFVMDVPIMLWTLQQPQDSSVSKAQFMDSQLRSKQKIEREIAQGTRKASDKENLVGRAEAVFGKQGWKTNKVWIERYPNFSKHFDFKDFNHSPWAQSFAVVTGNYMDDRGSEFPFHFHGKNPSSRPEDAKKFLPSTSKFQVPYSLKPNSMFIAPKLLDFRFKKRARLQDGTKKFAFEKVGLFKDSYRKTVPDKAHYRKNVALKFRKTPSTGSKTDLSKLNQRFEPPAYLKLAK